MPHSRASACIDRGHRAKEVPWARADARNEIDRCGLHPCACAITAELRKSRLIDRVAASLFNFPGSRMSSTDQDVALELRRARISTAENLAATIEKFAEPLPALRRVEEFGTCFDRFGDARVVLLVEATHGTAEFYAARAAITRRLIEQLGFTIVAAEADRPDARADTYVRHRAAPPRRACVLRLSCDARRSQHLRRGGRRTAARLTRASFEETSAVTPLPAGHAQGAPDTYPFGM